MAMTATNVIDLTGQKINLSSFTGWPSWWEVGLDMGSGITTVYAQPVHRLPNTKDRTERGPLFRLSIPSVVDTGEKLLERIANGRAAPKNRSASVLGAGEFVLRPANSLYEHLVGKLAYLEGEHFSDAINVDNRYWGEHIRVIAQTVLGALIPDTHAEIHLNMCMPLSLYTSENKEQAKNNLDGVYACYVNEIYHELDIRVGAVIPEGYGAITAYGTPAGNNVAIDIGDRTTEVVVSKGFTLVTRDSAGETYGVREVIEAIQQELTTVNRRSLDVEEVRVLLKGYTSRLRLPSLRVPKGSPSGFLDSDAQYELITRKIIPVARALAKLIRATLNREGAEIGSHLDRSIIYGGGGYLFHSILRDGLAGDPELENGVLRDLELPPEAEYINARSLYEMVEPLCRHDPAIWERKR